MHTNRLIDEKSPYLLQHAHNPVNWYPWGEEAFAKAGSEDKPIFLSIGYSTCHWCHVMEKESFESEETAELLNRHFVAIKVDREERPDVDRLYMMFVQASTGGGGWPMSVWLTPDRKPFFGGTYFPPDNRYGRPGFPDILRYIAQAWISERPKILESSTQVLAELGKQAEIRAGGTNWLDDSVIESGYNAFRRSYDTRLGGFGQAPKFPRPVTHNFLVRYWKQTGNREALDMVLGTLQAMARGGMNDQIGGGFHRYSVDERWFVPHFEKMLYDQAQLAASYIEAYQITGEQQYAETAREVFDYVLRDMRHPDGGFYSAEDADSAPDAARPYEKSEGAFYIWTQAEIEAILGQETAAWFCHRYGVEPEGNVRQDPHGEFAGRNILYQAHSAGETAQRFGVDQMRVRMELAAARQKMMLARQGRVRPHLDDKVLAGWNGLMISALALGARALDEPRYELAAKQAAAFVLDRMYDGPTGTLLRRFRDGEAAIPGFLDDYAFLACGLIDLYETTFALDYLRSATALAEKMVGEFEDAGHGAFYSNAGGDESLLLRIKEDYDGAEPSGNSMAVIALLRLAGYTGRGDFHASAEKALLAFGSRLRAAPHGAPQMLAAYLLLGSAPRQIVLAGPAGAENEAGMLRAIRGRFLPNHTVLRIDSEEARAWFAKGIPAIAPMRALDGKLTAYVCRDFTCELPAADLEQLSQLLQ